MLMLGGRLEAQIGQRAAPATRRLTGNCCIVAGPEEGEEALRQRFAALSG